jgi:integrase/recombinase XerC
LDGEGHLFAWTYAQATYQLRSSPAGHADAWRGFHAARKHSKHPAVHRHQGTSRVGLFLGRNSVDTTRRYVAVEQDDVASEVEGFWGVP